MNSEIPMMPNQTPYTPEEMKSLSRIVAAAAQATDYFTEDELEEYAKSVNKENK